MINLLPPEDKSRLKHAYMVRLVSVATAFLGVLFMVALLLLLPSYFLSGVKEQLAEQKLANLQAETKTFGGESLNESIKAINDELALIRIEPPRTFINTTLDPILDHKNSGVSLRSIFISLETDSGKYKVHLEGVAPTRQALLDFVDTLKTVPKFTNVSLPISDFVKGKDINFSIELEVL